MDPRCHRLEAARSRPTVRRYVAETLEQPLERVLPALGRLRSRHLIPACGVALYQLAGLELAEPDAEACLAGLAAHRGRMAEALGRDPGWVVAAADFFSTEHPMLNSPAVGRPAPAAVDRAALIEAIGAEMRRAARSGRAFSLLWIAQGSIGDASLRETDRLWSLPEGVAMLLPGTDVGGARLAIERLVAVATGRVRVGAITNAGEGLAERLLERAIDAAIEMRPPCAELRSHPRLEPRRGADEP